MMSGLGFSKAMLPRSQLSGSRLSPDLVWEIIRLRAFSSLNFIISHDKPPAFIGGLHGGRIAVAGGSCTAVMIYHSPPLWGRIAAAGGSCAVAMIYQRYIVPFCEKNMYSQVPAFVGVG
ncbi:hypothetical protein L873DRAFT_1235856 [Choiromyces venosus 120613-1]|uniref:Uncharacterized protein n=1 Tax=Choiromyces venosus 120613-1 TaxID=1336337 RepID=A0A3N4JDF8_9PEZI|nr:hypothetical protein L873DRAFT_1235856 [Choiromyces venosus 120613-1]